MSLGLENCDLLLEMGFNVHVQIECFHYLVSDLKRRATQSIVPSGNSLSTTVIFPNETSNNLAELRCEKKNY